MSAQPPDAWSAGAFTNGPNGWQPPAYVRTLVWLVKDVGIPTVLSGVFVAVVLGWVDSPLTRISHVEKALEAHINAQAAFQTNLITGLRDQRCLQAVTSISGRPEMIVQAALSDRPCVYLEHMSKNSK